MSFNAGLGGPVRVSHLPVSLLVDASYVAGFSLSVSYEALPGAIAGVTVMLTFTRFTVGRHFLRTMVNTFLSRNARIAKTSKRH